MIPLRVTPNSVDQFGDFLAKFNVGDGMICTVEISMDYILL
jgi:hypothetical protein